MKEQEILLRELNHHAQHWPAEEVGVFVGCDGIRHLFAVSAKWTREWRSRLDVLLLQAVNYMLRHPCGKSAMLNTPGVVSALTLNLNAPTDDVRIQTLDALTALSKESYLETRKALRGFGIVCQGQQDSARVPFDAVLRLMMETYQPEVKEKCLNLIDALISAPASLVERAWTLRILHDELGRRDWGARVMRNDLELNTTREAWSVDRDIVKIAKSRRGRQV